MKIENIEFENKLFAIIVRGDEEKEDTNLNNTSNDQIKFISDESHSMQVAYHKQDKGHHYKAHISKPFQNGANFLPNKVYLVQKGKIACRLFSLDGKLMGSVELNSGDLIIFIYGGHDVDVLCDNSKFIEIKQGPYRGREDDKVFLE
jgi:hypothetical protein